MHAKQRRYSELVHSFMSSHDHPVCVQDPILVHTFYAPNKPDIACNLSRGGAIRLVDSNLIQTVFEKYWILFVLYENEHRVVNAASLSSQNTANLSAFKNRLEA